MKKKRTSFFVLVSNNNSKLKTVLLLFFLIIMMVMPAWAADQIEYRWTRQLGTLGTSVNDEAYGVAVDGSGNIYVAGYTSGGLDGNTSAGAKDLILVKYASDGTKLWTRQLGTSADDEAYGVAVDGSGNIYVTGYTSGSLDGNYYAGGRDLFLVKYDPVGTKLWTKQRGTLIDSDEYATGVAVDGSGDVYVTGYTSGGLDGNTNPGGYDLFLVKYNPDGTWQWTRQRGTSAHDYATGVTVDGSGNVYVTGYTIGSLDGNTSAGAKDLFLVKYNPAGNWQWTRQRGTLTDEYATGVAVDGSGNVYVTGRTNGSLDGNTNEDGNDLFLVKYNPAGNWQWTRQRGTETHDYAYGVAVDGSGNVYVTGWTNGSFDGNTNAGGHDLFLAKYDPNGTWQWTRQRGTSYSDEAYGVAVDVKGNIYVTGTTNGGLDGNTNEGAKDLFLVKYGDITPPTTTLSISPPSPDGNNGWYKTTPSITLTSNEPGTTYYSWTSSSGPWTTYTGPFSAPNGVNTLYYYSADTAGNLETVKNYLVKVDTIAPTTTASPAGGTYISAQSVTLTCNDGSGSGCASTKYCLGSGCTPTTSYTGAINISSSNTLRFYSTDNAGNSETVKTELYIIAYTVTPSAGANGSISPSTPQTVNYNDTTSFTVTPNTGYHTVSVTGCGGTWTGTNPYTTGPITGDCTVTATFAINTYTVTPSAGANGSISPSTPQTVNYNATTSFTVTPNTGYHTVSVTGCGGTWTGTNPYTTGPITGDCTVIATFAINTYTVTPSAGAGGNINPSTPQTVNYNATTSFTVTPNTGYHTVSVTGCGGTWTGTNPYTTGPITSDCTVTATFAINTYTVTPSAGANGSISPSTLQTVNYNATTSFTVTPNTGYNTVSVTGCGGTWTGTNPYTTGPITSNCTVTASFAINTYTVTPSAGANGSISPSTPQTVNYNDTTSFTVTPNTGYHTVSVTGCGGTWTGTNPYTTGPITANCTVTATFAINTYTVTPSAGANGSISPSTPQTVNYNATTSFTVTPNTGYNIASVIGCGGTWTGTNPYTTGPITANCTVTATFAVNPLTITTSSPLPSGTLGTAYNQTLTATGGVPPYNSWSKTSGNLPNGLTLNSSTGVISGTPTATGTFNFIVQVADSDSPPSTATKNFSITIQSFNVRIWPDIIYHSAIQDAYDNPALGNGDTMQCQALVFNENVQCNDNVSFTLKGGYDANFTSNPNYTTISGSLTITNGTVVVENIIIQ